MFPILLILKNRFVSTAFLFTVMECSYLFIAVSGVLLSGKKNMSDNRKMHINLCIFSISPTSYPFRGAVPRKQTPHATDHNALILKTALF